jgi:lipoprotein-anchoring transpeptidase ErfK/SrfK
METSRGKSADRQMHRSFRAILSAILGVSLASLSLLSSPASAQTIELAAENAGHRIALVSIPDRKLAVLENGTVLATFPVAVGASTTPSPTGEFTIVTRVTDPAYYHRGKVIPSGKENPLGTRWLGLSQKGYGIHGTNMPRSVGHAASHGCIRLRNRDIEQLFTMLHVGDTVVIRAERDDAVAWVFGQTENEEEVANATTGDAAGGK